ncbi:uncharacterized protein [Cicer arietinum]|uniref:uncharacterized protein n=1 Tax=Cicer arietinum TaxID=3827 RepID=UPI003CC6D1AF
MVQIAYLIITLLFVCLKQGLISNTTYCIVAKSYGLHKILLFTRFKTQSFTLRFFCGAFTAMAILGKLDQLLAPKGLAITLAPLGAVFCSPICLSFNPFCRDTTTAAISF